jgi:hypothetical protein
VPVSQSQCGPGLSRCYFDIVKGLIVLRVAKKAYLSALVRRILDFKKPAAVNRRADGISDNLDLDVHRLSDPEPLLFGPKLSVIRAVALVQSRHWSPIEAILDEQEAIEMFGVAKPECYPKAVIITGLTPDCEGVVLPTIFTGDQERSVPSLKELAALTPDIAPLVQPSVLFDVPGGRAIDRVRVIDDGPVGKAAIVEALIQNHSSAGRERYADADCEGKTTEANGGWLQRLEHLTVEFLMLD